MRDSIGEWGRPSRSAPAGNNLRKIPLPIFFIFPRPPLYCGDSVFIETFGRQHRILLWVTLNSSWHEMDTKIIMSRSTFETNKITKDNSRKRRATGVTKQVTNHKVSNNPNDNVFNDFLALNSSSSSPGMLEDGLSCKPRSNANARERDRTHR